MRDQPWFVSLSYPHTQSTTKLCPCIPHFSSLHHHPSGPGLYHSFLDNYNLFLIGLRSSHPHSSPFSSQLPEPSCGQVEQLETPEAWAGIPEGIAQRHHFPTVEAVGEGRKLQGTNQSQGGYTRQKDFLGFQKNFLISPCCQHYCHLLPWISWAFFNLRSSFPKIFSIFGWLPLSMQTRP